MTFAPVGIRCPEHANIGAGQAERRADAPERASARRSALAAPGDDGADRDQRRRSTWSPSAQGGGINLPGGAALLAVGARRVRPSRTATGGGSSARCSSTAASSTRCSTCWRSTGSARSSSRRSARRDSSSSTSSRGSPARRERSGSAAAFAVTVGASGAIFGLIGALLILEYLATGSLMGQAMVLILVNLALTFAVPGISIGGHIGGLAGGIAATYRADAVPMPPNRAARARARCGRRRRQRRCSRTSAFAATASERARAASSTGRTTSATPSMRTTSTVVPSAIGLLVLATWRSSARCRPAPDPRWPGPASIAITTTARRPTTFERVRRHDGMRFIIRSSGLRVRSSATTVTTANTITWMPTSPPSSAVSAARERAERRDRTRRTTSVSTSSAEQDERDQRSRRPPPRV